METKLTKEELIEQRDELLNALNILKRYVIYGKNYKKSFDEVKDIVNSAIKKATE